jgi:hypothetical protein
VPFDIEGNEYELGPPDDLGYRERVITRKARRCKRHALPLIHQHGSVFTCPACDREDYERRHGVPAEADRIRNPNQPT